MKISIGVAALLPCLLLLPLLVPARPIGRTHPHDIHHHQLVKHARATEPNCNQEGRQARPRRSDTVQVAGSRLPDCSHACGSCSPCRLVMVSFVCSSLAEAETCPMAYKCMCNTKAYPVP